MNQDRLLARRLVSQMLVSTGPAESSPAASSPAASSPAASSTDDPAAVVRHFGAVQSQVYGQSLWGVGLRTRGTTSAAVEAAVNQGTILRTWPMRGTIHLVPAEDARWMTGLLAGRVVRRMASVYRRIGLTDEVLGRAAQTVAAALGGGRQVPRRDLYSILNAASIDCSSTPHGSRGGHVLSYLSMTGLVCIGPVEHGHPSFVLLDEWVPHPRAPAEPVTELVVRYFTSHGPAAEQDCGWWSGLTLTEVRAGISQAGAALDCATVDGQRYWHAAGQDPEAGPGGALLLAEYDEYTVAYKNRLALLGGPAAVTADVLPGDLLNPVMVLDGRVVGYWKPSVTADAVRVLLGPFVPLAGRQRALFRQAAERYGGFLGLPVSVTETTADDVRRRRPRPA